MDTTRRNVIAGAAATAGFAFTGDLGGLFTAIPAGAAPADGAGYGPLVKDPAGLLDLPAGFHYTVISKVGVPMPAGGTVPDRFDGTNAFATGKGVTLVRNHELSGTPPTKVAAPPEYTYDPGTPGGTTTVELDKHNAKINEYPSLGGTVNNCAGGLTPWGTWLSCEETEQKAGAGTATKPHGYVFEVDPQNVANNRNPEPLKAMGRLVHEAVCVDPSTMTAYLTEDANSPNGLLYRFTPTNKAGGYGSYRAGGVLEAMTATDNGKHVRDLSVYDKVGTKLAISWVKVPDPDAATTSVRKQFTDDQITRSYKFEGAWWGNGRAYIVCSFSRVGKGPDAVNHDGQIWTVDPKANTLTLEAWFGMNPDYAGDQIDGPDNITVSPYGGVVIAEDGEGVQHLQVVSPDGVATPIARNARDGSEMTGVCFSPDGKTLFAHIQEPGITFAITGPFTSSRGKKG